MLSQAVFSAPVDRFRWKVGSTGCNELTCALSSEARRRSKGTMAEKYTDQEFVITLVKALVAHPEDVKADRTVDEMGVLLTLHVHPDDMGYVIGRQGQTARAIRTLLKVVGAKNNARVNLKIHEPEGSRKSRPAAPAVDNDDTSVIDDLKI